MNYKPIKATVKRYLEMSREIQTLIQQYVSHPSVPDKHKRLLQERLAESKDEVDLGSFSAPPQFLMRDRHFPISSFLGDLTSDFPSRVEPSTARATEQKDEECRVLQVKLVRALVEMQQSLDPNRGASASWALHILIRVALHERDSNELCEAVLPLVRDESIQHLITARSFLMPHVRYDEAEAISILVTVRNMGALRSILNSHLFSSAAVARALHRHVNVALHMAHFLGDKGLSAWLKTVWPLEDAGESADHKDQAAAAASGGSASAHYRAAAHRKWLKQRTDTLHRAVHEALSRRFFRTAQVLFRVGNVPFTQDMEAYVFHMPTHAHPTPAPLSDFVHLFPWLVQTNRLRLNKTLLLEQACRRSAPPTALIQLMLDCKADASVGMPLYQLCTRETGLRHPKLIRSLLEARAAASQVLSGCVGLDHSVACWYAKPAGLVPLPWPQEDRGASAESKSQGQKFDAALRDSLHRANPCVSLLAKKTNLNSETTRLLVDALRTEECAEAQRIAHLTGAALPEALALIVLHYCGTYSGLHAILYRQQVVQRQMKSKSFKKKSRERWIKWQQAHPHSQKTFKEFRDMEMCG